MPGDLESRYGLKEITSIENGVGTTNAGLTLTARLRSRFKDVQKLFHRRAKRLNCQTSVAAKARWAIHDEPKFSNLVDTLEIFIDGLRSIITLPEIRIRQQDLLFSEIQHRPVREILQVRDASHNFHEDISDAATGILASSVIDEEDRRRIVEWSNEVSVATGPESERKAALIVLSRVGRTLDDAGRRENLRWAAMRGHDRVVRIILDDGHDYDINVRVKEELYYMMQLCMVGPRLCKCSSKQALILKQRPKTAATLH